MVTQNALAYTAFEEGDLIAHGTIDEIALKLRKKFAKNPSHGILVFSDLTGRQIDLDLRGSEDDVLERLKVYLPVKTEAATSGPGRPKLGVVAREVSLLPIHWEWLATQPGGASATLRKLIDKERKDSEGKQSIKFLQERTYQFLTAVAGNLPNYEEAMRALFSKDAKKFKASIHGWPTDIVKHSSRLSEGVWS